MVTRSVSALLGSPFMTVFLGLPFKMVFVFPLLLACLTEFVSGAVVNVNYGYFKDPAAHSWTYAVDAHTWTDAATGTEYKYTFWPQTGGGKVIKKLQTGELDIAHLGSSPYSSGALRGVPMTQLYVIHVKDLSQCLVARRGLNTPNDLKGKRVAYVGGSTTHFMFSGLMLAAGLVPSDFEWLGHMEAGDQMAAWDRGEIDAGFMWGGGMLHLQSSPWCSQPDTSSPNYRPCDTKAAGSLGRNLFTSGTSKMWGTEVWNNLVVSNAFAAAHPETVFRTVKVVSAIDTKMVSDGGFFTNSADRMCAILMSVGRPCTSEDESFWAGALYWDTFLSATQQVGGGYMGEKVPGECARQSIGQYPNNDGPCNAETAAGSAVSAWAASEFSYNLKRIGYLPSIKYFDSLLDPQYIAAAADPALDRFPEITAESLAANHSTPASGSVVNPATNFCGQQAQPIRLSGASGVLQDHQNGGFHQDGVRCDWQLDATSPLMISNIDVRIERDADNVYIYEGLCTGSDCSQLPLLATFTGGKGTGPNTLHQLNPRPPVLVASGQATISFVPDATADLPLLAVVDDGVRMEWSLAPTGGACALPCQNAGVCQAGQCKCIDGWAGADCSSPTCMGTMRLSASAAPGIILNGVQTSPTAHNADCRWEIVADDPSWVVAVELQVLDLDWGFDPLEFFEGIGLTGTSLGRFSGYFTPKLNAVVGEKCPGPQCPGYIVSSTSSMTVRWSSDSMASGLGFTLRYHAGPPADFVCGTGSVANCGSRGTCSPSGCVCDDGWYGPYCKLQQCTGETVISGLKTGHIRNMATSEAGYGPNRACTWVIRAPQENGQEAGAIAIFLERFDLEENDQSQDSMTIGATTLTGSSRPCLSTAANRSSCRPEVVLGAEATIHFNTDTNDYPYGTEHEGFHLVFEAIYDCPKGADGRCLALSNCALQGMVPGRVVCEPCPAHQHFDALTQTCRVCGQGLVPGPNQLTCVLCDAGKVAVPGALDGRCQSCLAGKFAAQRGMTECVDCEPGTFAELTDRVACQLASMGHFVNVTGAVRQTPCSPGSVSGEMGLSECKPCHQGTAQDMGGRSACDRCKRGTFAGTGAQSCSPCPGSHHGGPFTMTTDETGTAIAEQCGCPQGSYRGRDSQSTKCHPCPEGMQCDFGADEQTLWNECDRPTDPEEGCVAPLTKPGYMTELKEPLSVWQCENSERCPGGLPGHCAPLLVGLSCQHCVEGHQWDGRECIQCSDFAQGAFLFPILPILMIPMLVILFYKLFGDKIDRWGSWQNGCASLLFILLNHFQIVTILRGVNMEVPLQVGQAYEVLSISSDFTGLFQPECTGYAKFQDSLLLKSSGPLIVLGVFIMVWAASQVVARYCRRRLAMEKNRTINAFLSIIFAFFGAIVEMAFAIFKCGPNPNGRSTMLADRSIVCFNDVWRDMLVIGIAAVLVWCIGFAALLVRTILLAPYWFDDERVQMRWKFLFIKYRPDVHWWALVIVCKGILLQQGQLFLDSGIAQLYYLMTVMLLYVVSVTVFRPWRHLLVNLVDAWAHLCMLMSASAMISYAEDRLSAAEKLTLDQQMSAISLTWCFLVIPVAAAVLFSMIWIQQSSNGKMVVQKSMDIIKDAFLLVKSTENKEIDLFLASTGQVDFYIYHAAAVSLLAELGGRRSRTRVTPHAHDGNLSPAHSYDSHHPHKRPEAKLGPDIGGLPAPVGQGEKAVDAGPDDDEVQFLELEEIDDEELGPSLPPISSKSCPGGAAGGAAAVAPAPTGAPAPNEKPEAWLLEPGLAPAIRHVNSDSYSC